MEKAWLFIWLVMGHFVFDWLLQTNWMAMNKKNNPFALLVHSLVYALGVTITLFFAIGAMPTLSVFAVVFSPLFVSHVLLDSYHFHVWWCIYIKRMPPDEIPLWMLICIDQIWHILILFGLIEWLKH